MLRTLDTNMLNISCPLSELAPLAAKYGIEALSVPSQILYDEVLAHEATSIMQTYGLSFGLLPMPADFYHWDLDDEAFERALEELARRAALAEKLGITHAYNHIWSCSPREYDESFEWTVNRVRAVSRILADHGVRYGLEFLGPHEIRSWQKHEFVHSLSGVLAIADAADGIAGVAFDTYHWYCSGACTDDLLLMQQHTDRLVAVHLNDAVEGIPYDQQKDQIRRLPMETGVIDSRAILSRFSSHPSDALCMIEPFEPNRTRFHAMSAEDAVSEVAEIFEKLFAKQITV